MDLKCLGFFVFCFFRSCQEVKWATCWCKFISVKFFLYFYLLLIFVLPLVFVPNKVVPIFNIIPAPLHPIKQKWSLPTLLSLLHYHQHTWNLRNKSCVDKLSHKNFVALLISFFSCTAVWYITPFSHCPKTYLHNSLNHFWNPKRYHESIFNICFCLLITLPLSLSQHFTLCTPVSLSLTFDNFLKCLNRTNSLYH